MSEIETNGLLKPEQNTDAESANSLLGQEEKQAFTDKVMVVMTGIMLTITGLALPLSMLMLYDRVVPNQTRSTLYSIFVILVLVGLFELLIKTLQKKIINYAAVNFEMKMHERMFSAILNANLSQYFKREQGEYLESVRDVGELKEFYSGQSLVAHINAFSAVITAVIIGMMEPFALIVPVIVIIGLAIMNRISDRKTQQILQQSRELESNSNSRLIEVIRSVDTLKGYAMESRVENWLRPLFKQRERLNFSHTLQVGEQDNRTQYISGLAVIMQVLVCAGLVIQGELSQGAMAAIVMLMNRFSGPLQQSFSYWSRYKQHKIYKNEIEQVLSLDEGQADNPHQLDDSFDLLVTQVNGKDVMRQYKLSPGMLVCVTGSNGGGKTRWLKRLAGYNFSSTKDVMVSGRPLNQYAESDWSKKVTYIDQETDFINASIIDNLTCFRPHLNSLALAICDAFKIRDEINLLSKGFYTQVTNGLKNTVPNKIAQSLLIVQAIVNGSHVVLLDNVDWISDEDYIRSLDQVIRTFSSRHIFVVSTHNPIIINNADLVISVEG
ncbi:ABC transporter transmembrane domain-containing protein [Photobacterium sanctipauli]|uniref:ABC transporter transmembrane domain-containing protein n=1 Tax=Photobacterium sanctipauli TaxID=1342794 RepID=UPI0013049719|nr:ABC transporter transmembrane domain-containing protein [Photobacterium sanctipauli]